MPYKIIRDDPARIAPTRPTERSRTGAGRESRQKIAFLMRKNPRLIGGVQRLSARVIEAIGDKYDIHKIGWTGPEWGVPLYFPMFYQKSKRSGAALAHCDDAVTALVGAQIKARAGKKVTAAVHGLDVILPIPWYQKRVSLALQSLDKVVCVSRATAERVRERGVDSQNIAVIHPAADDVPECSGRNDELYDYIYRTLGINLRGKKALLSVGRTVKRKGFDRFITDVFMNLPDDYIYIVAGSHPRVPPWINYLKPILSSELYHLLMLASGCYSLHEELMALSRHPRIFYINGAPPDLRDKLYCASDLFIMPNRTVPGDMEGFGIVALEAAVRGLPTVAAGIEGITDAVVDGKTGYCVSEGDNAAMKNAIESIIRNPQERAALGCQAREFARRNFGLKVIGEKYSQVFQDLLP